MKATNKTVIDFGNNNKMSFNDIIKISKQKGIEVDKKYNTNILNKLDSLKDFEFMYCLKVKIFETNAFTFFVKNERTDKEVVFNEVIFEPI